MAYRLLKNHLLWGLEEAIEYDKVQASNPEYDIGIYSSGHWARIDGLYRTLDIKRIKNGEFLNNSLNILFKEIVLKICKIANQNNLTVMVYLHPFEKILYHDHGLKPPYLELIKKNLRTMFDAL